MKWFYVTDRSQRRRRRGEVERGRRDGRRGRGWQPDWWTDWPDCRLGWLLLSGQKMHRSTEQTQTCHFRRLIQSVMIFPHLASSVLSLPPSLPLSFSLQGPPCSSALWLLSFFFLYSSVHHLQIYATLKRKGQEKNAQDGKKIIKSKYLTQWS